MSVPSGVGGRHAAPVRLSWRTPLIGSVSVAGVLALYSLGTVVVGQFDGSPRARTDAAAWAPSAPATASSVSPTPADSPSSGTTASSPSPSPSPSPAPAGPSPGSRPPTTRGPAPAGAQLCRLAEHGGTFYLYVTGDTTHRARACAGAAPYVGTIGQLLSSASGMDRRCVLDPDHNSHNHNDATVAVYSDMMRPNLTAAYAYCNANGGSGRD